jgi:BON domain
MACKVAVLPSSLDGAMWTATPGAISGLSQGNIDTELWMNRWFSFLGRAVLVASFSLVGCNRAPARSDAQVAAEVQGNLQRDGRISSNGIEVMAEHGVVTLGGDVASDDERASAAKDAAQVAGVKTVINNLVVRQAQAGPPVDSGPSAAAPVAASPARKNAPPTRRSANLPPAPTAEPATNPVNAPATSAPAIPPAAAMAQVPPTPPPTKKITVPAGTQVTIRLNEPLDTERNQVGDTFHAALGAPIVVDSETVIPSGADVVGRVVDVKSAGRFAGNSVLTLELNSLSVNGKTYNIQTNQWSRQGKGEGKNTAVKAGGGAAIGAIIGGLAGGGKGAAIGSVAGAGAGTGAAATKKGEQIKLAPEATLSFLLINTVTVIQQTANNRSGARNPLP